jgi:energy-coupling factor transporter ATP-binding protein EcfA2
MAIVVYRGDEKPKNSWVRYFNRRIQLNKNNLVVFTGTTGSGKTWSAISILELMTKEDGVSFTIDHIVFSLKELMELINSGKLVKGSKILFDEPQVSISSRDFMSETNKVFNFLLSTFRHRNWTLFFCTPYEDLLDKATRKLFHAKFETMSININTKTCRIKPKVIEYNSQLGKFYEKFLRVSYKPKQDSNNVVNKLKFWDIPKPSPELIKVYEEKKLAFTTKLNREIMLRLQAYEVKKQGKVNNILNINSKPLTPLQEKIVKLWEEGTIKQVDVNKILNIDKGQLSLNYKWLRNKGYNPNIERGVNVER